MTTVGSAPFLAPAEMSRLDVALRLVEEAKEDLRAWGVNQWQQGYPDRACLEADFRAHQAWFLMEGDAIAGYLCLSFAGEPAYAGISGQWGAEGPYGVVHRLTLDRAFRGRGLARAALRLAEDRCAVGGMRSLRLDTHPDNRAMQRMLEEAGYVLRGTIFFDKGPKLAYDILFPRASAREGDPQAPAFL